LIAVATVGASGGLLGHRLAYLYAGVQRSFFVEGGTRGFFLFPRKVFVVAQKLVVSKFLMLFCVGFLLRGGGGVATMRRVFGFLRDKELLG
jgi:hypothetical protein